MSIIRQMQDAGANAWLKYPSNLESFDSVAIDGDGYSEELNRISDVVFSETTEVEALESSDRAELEKTSIENEDDLDRFLAKHVAKLLALSVSQEYSLAPLSISQSSLLKILSHYQVSPEFLHVLSGFGDKQSSSDEVLECGSYKSFDKSTYEISYQIWYMEKNKRLHGDPWSLRQTGVYHKCTGVTESSLTNLWILLHPSPKTKLHKRLEVTSVLNLEADPLRLHLLIFSSYMDNWRQYFHDMTREFLAFEGDLMTSELLDSEDYTTFNFDTLQTLRHLAGKLIPIPTMLKSSINTIKSIMLMNETLTVARAEQNYSSKALYYLQAYESRLEGYLAACLVLQARIENMTKFASDGLNLRNQKITAESNGHLVTLTKKSVGDSATVKAITLVTLIYLPATFISGLLGSNLFNFQDATSNFQISRQWWIYFAATIPLTILTLGYWQYKSRQQRKQKMLEDARSAQRPGIV